MSIGYSVEGSTDRAFLEGLRRRWRPDAALIEGSFRGASGISLRRDIPRICQELGYKGARVIKQPCAGRVPAHDALRRGRPEH